MTSIAQSRLLRGKPQVVAIAALGGLILAAIALPNLNRSRSAIETAIAPDSTASQTVSRRQYAAAKEGLSASLLAGAKPAAPARSVDAITGRKLVRTSSMELLVQHPDEVSDKIAAIVEKLGGYLVSANAGGQSATSGTLTVRVPAAKFEEARLAIRSLGLRVESENIEAQDVTRQYVDQDASLRNLKAQEVQYLSILKQASTVQDMIAVSEKLNEVRGEIEQQQAEFNTLSQQIDTVAISIALRTESQAQVLGLNWRPLYQLKLAVRNGLESLTTYATTMMAIALYIPATLLWLGTILAAVIGSWGLLKWIGRRWLGWSAQPNLQN